MSFMTNVAGVSFRPEAVAQARKGMKVSLVREPDNPHDPNAVAVWDEFEAMQFGYIKRQYAWPIARAIDRGDPVSAVVAKTVGGENGMSAGITIRISLG